MDFRQLQYLVTLSEERHFAQAADICCVTQPTLSSRIKQLEDEFGVRLVHRDQRYRGLTEHGEVFVKWAKRVLDDASNMKNAFNGSTNLTSNVLTIGVISSATPIASICTSYLQNSGICQKAEIHTLDSKEIHQGLTEGSLTIGISHRESYPECDAKKFKVCVESYAAVYMASDAEDEMGVLDWRNLKQKKLCLPANSISSRRVIDRCFGDASDSILPGLETDCWLTMLQSIRRNGLVGIMPLHIIGLLTIPQEVRVQVLPEPKEPLCLYFLSSPQIHYRAPARRAIEALPGIQDLILQETGRFSTAA